MVRRPCEPRQRIFDDRTELFGTWRRPPGQERQVLSEFKSNDHLCEFNGQRQQLFSQISGLYAIGLVVETAWNSRVALDGMP